MPQNPDKKTPWVDKPSARLLLGGLIPGLIIFAWYLGIRSGTAVVPKFSEVAYVLLHPFEEPEDIFSSSLAFSTLMTLLRLALGFGLGVITAVPLGLLAGRSKTIESILGPAVNMARPINPIVLLPIATVFFGLASVASVMVGEAEAWRLDILDQIQAAMVVILWWGAFFPIFISTVHGVKSARKIHIEALEMMGASHYQVFTKALLPGALPHSINGMRIGMGVTWLVLIAAEIFPGTRSGLGYMLCVACKTSDYQYTFAAIIVIGIIAYITDALLYKLEKAAGHWQAGER